MSSFCSHSSLAVPLKLRRHSSSESTPISMDSYMYAPDNAIPSSSSLLSSSLLLTPLHPTRRNGSTEWQAGDSFDDPDGHAYDPRHKTEEAVHPWSYHARPEYPLPYIHRPLPSLMSKFATHALRNNSPASYSPSQFSLPQTSYLYTQGDTAIADGYDEHDLESMDIHIRETYFATSAERGRWLSSPVAPRVRSRAVPPTRGHSSPAKTPGDASPLKERFSVRKRSGSTERHILPPSTEDSDEDACRSSPLPPSSPLTSPMSNLSSLSDDCEDDFVGEHGSNSDDSRFFSGTPELSTSTTCTSPIESTRTPTPHEILTIVPAGHLTDFPCHSPSSVIPRHTSPCTHRLPQPIDVHVHLPDTTNPEPDDNLSPLSEFELDLPEPEPSKLPLSDTLNRPYPTASPDVNAAWDQGGPSCIPTLSTNPSNGPLDISLGAAGGSSSIIKTKKRKKSRSLGGRQSKKRAVARPGSPPSDTTTRRGGSCTFNPPPSKKPKLSRCGDDSGSRGTKSVPRRNEKPKVERASRSPSRLAVGDCGSEFKRRNATITASHAQLRQSAPCSPTILAAIMVMGPDFQELLTGMLIEALATSRATSMDAAELHIVITRAHPQLAVERSKEELLMDVAAVLEAGRTQCGMFERVDSSGEKTRHKALESRWFYVPERDEDRERASLISAIMPRQKRNETKKYKQYYYRPLDKISRWDPEDAP